MLMPDLGEVKTVTRVRNGITQQMKLYTRVQRKIIIEMVEKRPEGTTIEEALKPYGVIPAVYYSWLKKQPEVQPDVKNHLPNPFEDLLGREEGDLTTNQLRAFYEAKSPELIEFIEKKFQEWEKTDLISQIVKRVTPENISEVAKAGDITVDELRSFLGRSTKSLTFYSVEAIRRYLGI